MKFIPTYKTVDGNFEVAIDTIDLPKTCKIPTFNKMLGGYSPKNATVYNIKVYNTVTDSYSNKQIYLNKDNRLYFNGRSGKSYSTKRFYIDELIPITRG